MRDRRRFSVVWIALAMIGALGLTACQMGPSEEELKAQKDQEDWAAIEQLKAELDAQRAELRALGDQMADAASETAEDVEESAEDAAADLEAKAEELQQDIDTKSEELTAKLIEFINAQNIVEGEELTEKQTAAIRLKSDEEIVIAQEYIDKAGDYTRAIDIYQTALVYDPDNEKLKAALAQAQENRFMTKERFGQVKKKMTQAEVRELLGQVKTSLNREYEQDDAVAWFYEKEEGGAAGVFFRESRKGRGDWAVYHTDFDAIKPKAEDA